MSGPQFQKKQRWAVREALWAEVVVCAEDVAALAAAGGVEAAAELAYLDRGKNRALRTAGWTKDEIVEDMIQADWIFIQGLSVLGGEEG